MMEAEEGIVPHGSGQISVVTHLFGILPGRVVVAQIEGHNHRGIAFIDVALGPLAVAEVAVPDQIMGQAPGHVSEEESVAGVLQDRAVPAGQDMVEVFPGATRPPFVEGVVTEPAGQLANCGGFIGRLAHPIRFNPVQILPKTGLCLCLSYEKNLGFSDKTHFLLRYWF
jgi:hypothetical protein